MGDFMSRVRELGGLFWRSAKESGEAAADALEQRAHIQRLAIQVRKLDRERAGLISQIGKKVYGLHQHAKVRNQDVLVDCKRIDQIMADIAGLQKEIESIRAASLEKGIEVPILSDETPLDGEEAVTAAPAEPTREGVARATAGRVEFSEEGKALVCEPGPSTPSKPQECEVEVELTPAAPAGVKPAGTFGQQDLSQGGIARASQGRAEFDEEGGALLCDEGPSTSTEPEKCDVQEEAGEGTPPSNGPSEESLL